MTGPRPRTRVYVEEADNSRWRVRVQYPNGEPVTLLSTPSEEEAIRAARGYAARYRWKYEEE